MEIEIREVGNDDIEAMLRIYAPYVLETPISFEYVVPSVEEFGLRVKKTIDSKFPWIVASKGNDVIGYAYAGALRTRAAYQWSCEVSVYVDQGSHGLGVGKKLYSSLLEKLKERGFQQVFAGVTSPNQQSQDFHASFNFRMIGVYQKIGFKFDQWHDVTWYQLDLSEYGR